ncbi:MAG: aminopeptidase P family protein [Microscillaceae bacterium]|nr:aminopeptidase P family protein [Microscillaceae bacterium]MDW8461538.1 aminopeptidase P family protein [Cytophagales bacterium]
MRYSLIPKELFIHNRNRFVQYLKPKSLAVLNANDIMPTNADGTMPFRQNSDIFYLSGIDQEQTILLLFPDAQDEDMRELLFLTETNEEIAIWEGEKLTKEKAYSISGIKAVHWLYEFPRIFHTLMSEAEYVYLNTNEHTRAVVEVETRDARFIKYCKERYPLHKYERLAPIMHQLRAVKSPWEIELLQTACHITELGFRRVLKTLKPGMMEYEIEAEFIYEFIRNRSRGSGYTPIIASGANACILHYTQNNQPCKDGDLLLIDIGAEYANYNADMSRTIPVNGKFNSRQRAVYDAVLRVMRQAKELLKVGNTIVEYHKAVGEIVTKELVDLGLLTMNEVNKQDKKKPAYKKYFMHGTSHYLGLDVHDVGSFYRKLEPGMVFTCEPGIYIREEGLGIRLENDILITKDGNLDLMQNIPIEAEEIEEIMQKR